MANPLNGSRVLRADKIELWDSATKGHKDVLEIAAGLPAEDIATVQAIASVFDSDPDYFSNTAASIASKQPALNILPVARALISSGSGQPVASGITSTELGRLSGLTADLQFILSQGRSPPSRRPAHSSRRQEES